MAKPKNDSLAKGLNRRLALRLLWIFLALDALLAALVGVGLWLWRAGRLDLWGGLQVAALTILAVELIGLTVSKFRNAGLIKKTLQPLTDLSAAAAELSGKDRGRQLSDLAGRLGQIDAAQLDTRLPVENTQAELKELTQAINAFLERMDGAYAAQIRFVSDASHELRTPIAVIQGYANLLNRWGKDDPAARQEAIDAITAEAAAMEAMMEKLLFLARGDNHTMKIEMVPTDVTEIAAQVLKETAMLDQTHILSADWQSSVTVTADPGLLKEALRILVDNAVKYTPPGGRIILAIADTGTAVRLTVKDQGQGIDKESLPHVFERFYRADESRTRQTGGSGLGLPIALWIATRHGGSMEARSCPGLGSHFTIVLPKG